MFYPPQYTPQAKRKKDRAASVLFPFALFCACLILRSAAHRRRNCARRVYIAAHRANTTHIQNSTEEERYVSIWLWIRKRKGYAGQKEKRGEAGLLHCARRLSRRGRHRRVEHIRHGFGLPEPVSSGDSGVFLHGVFVFRAATARPTPEADDPEDAVSGGHAQGTASSVQVETEEPAAAPAEQEAEDTSRRMRPPRTMRRNPRRRRRPPSRSIR